MNYKKLLKLTAPKPTLKELHEDVMVVRDALRAETSRHQQSQSDNTWFALCFQSEEEKAMALEILGAALDSKYVDGAKLLALHGKEKGPAKTRAPRIQKRWVGLI